MKINLPNFTIITSFNKNRSSNLRMIKNNNKEMIKCN